MFDEDGRTQPLFQPDTGRTFDQYRILAKLGEGGMGEVYLAEDTKLDRSVALKFLPPTLAADATLRARFKREAKAVASLHHPNIVHVYDVGEHQNRPYIAMEHVDGANLRDVLEAGPLPLERALAYTEALAGALAEAHTAGVVHRDVKPSNVVVDSSDRPKLLDFGLAVLPRDEAITKTGTTLGTVGYMAPEQVRGEPVDHRADLFSLGVVLYEMVTGKQPFRGDTDIVTLDRVLHRVQDPVARFRAEVPDDVERVLARLLEKDPAVRYQSAADLAADLKRIRRRSEGSMAATAMTSPAGHANSVPSGDRRARSLPAWLIPVAVLAVLALVTFAFKPWSRIPAPIVAEAEAIQSRIVILDFQNLAGGEGNQNIGAIVSSLLVTDLSESHFLQVVSRQRILDIARSLGHDVSKPIEASLFGEIASKASGKWMLTGTILQTEPSLVLTSQLTNVSSGDVVASQRVSGDAGDNVFAVVDKLTRELKQDLALPTAAETESDPSIAQITTSSPEAYRHYVAGVDYYQRFFKNEANEEFKRAIEIDSAFASAYFLLAILNVSESKNEEARHYLDAALRHIDRTNWRERLNIRALDLEFRGDMEAAVALLRQITDRVPEDPLAWHVLAMTVGRSSPDFIKWNLKAIEADSSFAVAYNQLAYAYLDDDRFEEANRAINRYVALLPNDPNPYDSQGDIYARQGLLEEARESYEKAYEIKPDFLYSSRYKLGSVNLLLGDDDEALRIFRELADGSTADERTRGRRGIVEVHLYRGRYEAAHKLLETEIADAEASGRYRTSIERYGYLAGLYTVIEEHDLALEAMERAIALVREHYPGGYPWIYDFSVGVACRAGREDLTEQYTEELSESISPDDDDSAPVFPALGNLAMSRGEYDEAVRLYRLVNEQWTDFYDLYYLGRALRFAGLFDEAVVTLIRADRYVDDERLVSFPLCVLVHYELGRAYEGTGENENAIAAYEKFLGIWRDTEYTTPEMKDAAERLKALRPGS